MSSASPVPVPPPIWLDALLEDTRFSLRAPAAEVKLIERSVGRLQISTGSLTLANAHPFSMVYADKVDATHWSLLDAQVDKGAWTVETISADAKGSSGEAWTETWDSVVSALVAPGSSMREALATATWSEATSSGLPLWLDPDVVIGDTRDVQELGAQEPGADAHPLRKGSRDLALIARWPGADGDRTVYRAEHGNRFRAPWWVNKGRCQVWLAHGRDGEVSALVFDWLTSVVQMVVRPVVAPWDEVMPRSGARLVGGVELWEEDADVASLFDPKDEHIRRLGDVVLDGQLTVMAMPWKPSRTELEDLRSRASRDTLPVEFTGSAIAYAYPDDGMGNLVTLIRFGAGRPVRWSRMAPPASTDRQFVLASTSTLDALRNDPKLASEVYEYACWGGPAPGHADQVLPCSGDGLSVWLLGFDDADQVIALVMAEDADNTLYTVRPEKHDAPLLAAVRAHREEADPEDFEDALSMLEDDLRSSDGVVTPAARGQLHWIYERFVARDTRG